MGRSVVVEAALWLCVVAVGVAGQSGGGGSSMSSAMPVAIGAGFAATVLVVALLLLWRRKKDRRVRRIKAREMEQYEKAVELERATRALQRAREVLAQRTGNADWDPKLQANVQSMQLDEMDDDDGDEGGPDGMGEWRTDGPFKMGPGAMNQPGMEFPDGEDAAVAVCEKAIQLVAEFGAQGAMIQVMYAAKKQLERELRDLEHSEGIINVDGGLEEESEDPEWRERVKDQMQLKELERQLAAVDEETVGFGCDAI
jgi:uncharacterized spore protein YtfJ